MKKVDIVSWLLSVTINLLILFLIAYKPFFKEEKVETIKVGLVSLDSNAQIKFKGEQNRNALKQNLNATKIEETAEKNEQNQEQKKEVIKEEVIKEEVIKKAEKEESKKIVETKKEEKTVVIEDKNKESTEKTTGKVEEVKKEKPSLKDLKKSISQSKPNSKDLIAKDSGYNPNDGDFIYVDRALTINGDSNGLVSGNLNGNSSDGNVNIIWSNGNRNPSFPDTAKIQGKTGNMLIRVKVDQSGTVLSYNIEKGSGVPEIDLAVEKVISSWNLKMKKNNKIVAGVFMLDYKFDFK